MQVTTAGLYTIRAYGKQQLFLQRFCAAVDDHQRALTYLALSQRWFSMRLDLLTTLLVSSLVFLIVGEVFPLSAGAAGLAILYSQLLSGVFQWACRNVSDSEAHMTSVERIDYYASTMEQERDEGTLDPGAAWPARGEVRFERVSVRYRHNLPLVLKSLSVRIAP